MPNNEVEITFCTVNGKGEAFFTFVNGNVIWEDLDAITDEFDESVDVEGLWVVHCMAHKEQVGDGTYEWVIRVLDQQTEAQCIEEMRQYEQSAKA